MILIVIISSLFCFGIHAAYWYQPEWKENIIDPEPNAFGTKPPNKMNREILWFVKYYLGHALWPRAPWLTKPLFMCVICMASVYSSLVYWGSFYFGNETFQLKNIFEWVVIVVATCGLNRVIKTALNL